ncbi:hypothetical protein M422DRAFT_241180 [Sphaerobolus stellatus SS14]|nr:hypothetical protein M422DRAFT_241180 [Sphaerobolus stellatus SS14]
MAILLRSFVFISLSLILSTIAAPATSPVEIAQSLNGREEYLGSSGNPKVEELAIHHSGIHRKDLHPDVIESNDRSISPRDWWWNLFHPSTMH